MSELRESEHQIDVNVRTEFLAEQSSPDDKRFVFAYHITITNTGSRGARLLSRHWVITDGEERVQEVRGEGVVGEQPHLDPGEVFEYSSGAVLETPVGSMHGSYTMIDDLGQSFDTPIAPFTLAVPRILH